ncbi:MAG: hypothetical protein HQ557_00440 [Bacteroidetes bacterium]|nr:hypothetical protein [Bacteroidota bacterium]
MENKDPIIMADLSTSTNSIPQKSSNSILLGNEKAEYPTVDANPQLFFWMKAKDEYKKAKSEGRKLSPDEAIFITNSLGASLSFLFGRSYTGSDNGYTPSLAKLVEANLSDKDFNLERNDPELYANFNDLNGFYNDCTKHHDRTKIKKIEDLNDDKVEQFLETTRCIWIWFLLKKLNLESPTDNIAFSEFKNKFCELNPKVKYSFFINSKNEWK